MPGRQAVRNDFTDLSITDVATRIRDGFLDDLRRPPWRGSDIPSAGHCYVASEVLFHALGGKPAGWCPKVVTHEGATHWFLTNGVHVLDVTADQFRTPVPYGDARGCGFLTRLPSRRAVAMAAVCGLTP